VGFRDGATSTEQNPQHAYAASGKYDWPEAMADNVPCTKTGSVVILTAIPATATGMGRFSIGEVQKAINMFWKPWRPPAVWTVTGRHLSIGEVQKVINAFLGSRLGML